MKNILVITVLTIAASVSAAKSKKIDWSLCEREIKEFCSKHTDDHDKHECLEKLPKEKISEECQEKNKKLEDQFKGKHKHSH
jgi:hypothetical protein